MHANLVWTGSVLSNSGKELAGMDAEVVLQLHRTNEKTKAFFSAKLGKLGFGDVRSTEVVKSEGIDIGAWRKIEIIPHNFGTNPD